MRADNRGVIEYGLLSVVSYLVGAIPLGYVLIERPGEPPDLTFWALVAITALVVFKHRPNIRRILAGTESPVRRARETEEGVQGV